MKGTELFCLTKHN